MELYLDSADIKEIETAFSLHFLAGLTTTPTFMFREGVTNVDEMIVRLSKLVPVLQIEALGESSDEIIADAMRQLELGLDPSTTVFKIPMSLEGVIACKKLIDKGLMVNMHLIYTLQQAYMAMSAGATYICVLAGRMQDQGYDAMKLIGDCVEMVNYYGSDAKVMFSSVRHTEHVRNAIELGCHTITAPWKIIKALTENSFTDIGTKQFVDHTRQITQKVKDCIRPINPLVAADITLKDAIIKMTEYGFGAVSVVNSNNQLVGIFTDGDLRRNISNNGRSILEMSMGEFSYQTPLTISSEAILSEAMKVFRSKNVDTLIVVDPVGSPIGMLDIQDLNR
jgi:transaldolase